jgi:hypothetical protein
MPGAKIEVDVVEMSKKEDYWGLWKTLVCVRSLLVEFIY